MSVRVIFFLEHVLLYPSQRKSLSYSPGGFGGDFLRPPIPFKESTRLRTGDVTSAEIRGLARERKRAEIST